MNKDTLELNLDGKTFDGERDVLAVSEEVDLSGAERLTVEAWVESDSYQGERLQALVSKWKPGNTLSAEAFDAFDAGHIDGLDSKGFLGATFDGRYVYFSPQANTTMRENGTRRHGIALRYDTHGPFKDSKSWEAYDAGNTDGLETKGYYGAVFTGSSVYFVPRFDGYGFHTRVLRFNTEKAFKDPAAWDAYDVGLPISYQSGAFDGTYIYMVPGAGQTGGSGLVLRHDTRGAFKDRANWATFDLSALASTDTISYDGAVFDGRYIYFVPLGQGFPTRYDTRGSFEDPDSWDLFSDLTEAERPQRVGAIFDGRYIYYVPYGQSGVVLRFDTRGRFTDRTNWTSFDAGAINDLPTRGYDGAFFDGRFVYFVPYWDGIERIPGHYHGIVLRYDATRAFTDPASWDAHDAGNTDGLRTAGFNAGAFDGRYFYFSAWDRGEGEVYNIKGHGDMLRLDTLGDNGSFSLRYVDCGHNGGLGAALPGARFLINTDNGVFSVSADRLLRPGEHHLAGVYDGKTIKLYIDGELLNQQEASGTIVDNDIPITIGALKDGLGFFEGKIHKVKIQRSEVRDQ